MAVVRIDTEIEATADICFDLSRSVDLHLESMIASQERVAGGVTSGLIGPGQHVTWEARHLGRLWQMTARITEFDRPARFVDEAVGGPFHSFRHEHCFAADGQRTQMADVVHFRIRAVFGGRLIDPVALLYLRRLLTIRSGSIKRKAEAGTL